MINRPNILVVDDEPEITSLMQELLRRKGYTVFGANNGRQALDILEQENITILISDMVMPEMSGKELLISAKEKKTDLAVIMMTGYGDAFSIKEALSIGANEYITKPFKGDEVFAIVERVASLVCEQDKIAATQLE